MFRAYVKKCTTKKYRLSLVKIAAILSVVFTGFLVIYGFAYAKYEYEYFNDEYYTETPQIYYLSEITTEQRKVYADIKIGEREQLTEKKKLIRNLDKLNKERTKRSKQHSPLAHHQTDTHSCDHRHKNPKAQIFQQPLHHTTKI